MASGTVFTTTKFSGLQNAMLVLKLHKCHSIGDAPSAIDNAELHEKELPNI
jgi:hypothetical protein